MITKLRFILIKNWIMNQNAAKTRIEIINLGATFRSDFVPCENALPIDLNIF